MLRQIMHTSTIKHIICISTTIHSIHKTLSTLKMNPSQPHNHFRMYKYTNISKISSRSVYKSFMDHNCYIVLLVVICKFRTIRCQEISSFLSCSSPKYLIMPITLGNLIIAVTVEPKRMLMFIILE